MLEAFTATWSAGGFSPVTIENATGLLDRMLSLLGRPAWEVTVDDVDWEVGALSDLGITSATAIYTNQNGFPAQAAMITTLHTTQTSITFSAAFSYNGGNAGKDNVSVRVRRDQRHIVMSAVDGDNVCWVAALNGSSTPVDKLPQETISMGRSSSLGQRKSAALIQSPGQRRMPESRPSRQSRHPRHSTTARLSNERAPLRRGRSLPVQLPVQSSHDVYWRFGP